MTGRQADKIIHLWEELGADHFDLARLTRISPETYCAIAPAIRMALSILAAKLSHSPTRILAACPSPWLNSAAASLAIPLASFRCIGASLVSTNAPRSGVSNRKHRLAGVLSDCFT